MAARPRTISASRVTTAFATMVSTCFSSFALSAGLPPNEMRLLALGPPGTRPTMVHVTRCTSPFVSETSSVTLTESETLFALPKLALRAA